MTDDRKSGIALIAGSLGGILTMAIHPTSPLNGDQMAHLALASAIAHSLGMVSSLLIFWANAVWYAASPLPIG